MYCPRRIGNPIILITAVVLEAWLQEAHLTSSLPVLPREFIGKNVAGETRIGNFIEGRVGEILRRE